MQPGWAKGHQLELAFDGIFPPFRLPSPLPLRPLIQSTVSCRGASSARTSRLHACTPALCTVPAFCLFTAHLPPAAFTPRTRARVAPRDAETCIPLLGRWSRPKINHPGRRVVIAFWLLLGHELTCPRTHSLPVHRPEYGLSVCLGGAVTTAKKSGQLRSTDGDWGQADLSPVIASPPRTVHATIDGLHTGSSTHAPLRGDLALVVQSGTMQD